jgi:AcrR family transcriptional regulator
VRQSAALSQAAKDDAPTRVELLRVARRRFLQGERLDMRAMAAELGISRATVYRWAGNHDQLLGEVLSDLAHKTFAQAEIGIRQRGRARVLAVYRNVLTVLVESKPLQTALRRDPHQFLRVATRTGPVSRANTVLCEELLRREVERSALTLSTDVGALASAMVRIGEATIYADLLAGVEPDVDRSVDILGLLLGPPG